MGWFGYYFGYDDAKAIVHSFSSVAYVWLRGAKTTGLIAKKIVFS
jgi:hypothetical protein